VFLAQLEGTHTMVQYKTNVLWDSSLVDLQLLDTSGVVPVALRGLVIMAFKITTGAPAATAGYFAPSAMIFNLVDGTWYQMTGSTAAPAWTLNGSSSGFTLPVSATDSATTTGVSFATIMSAITTGIAQRITAVSVTTGKLFQAVAAAATMTTGRYFNANDGVADVWGIGANGHIHTAQTTAPTIAVSAQNGITAAAITAGASDTAGIVTTTGTNNNGGATVLQVTFNKTFTTAPKSVVLTPRNASGAGPNPAFVSAITATTFDITIPASASAGATPSWNYVVVA
jgi:hypothetical protein